VLLGGVAAQIYRYRRVSSQAERQQTRWVLFGLGATCTGGALMKRDKWTWLAWPLAGLIIVAALAEFMIWLYQRTGPTLLFDWVEAVGFGVALPIVFSVPAALIIARQPANRVGWLMMLVGLTPVAPLNTMVAALPSPPAALTPGIFLLVWFDAWSWIPLIFPIFLIPLNFPTGRPPTPRWNWVNRLALVMWLVFIMLTPFIDTVSPNNGAWSLPNPIGLIPAAAVNGPFMIVWSAGLLTMVAASVASLFVRYRRAQSRERQQITWLLYAGAWFLVVYASGLLSKGSGHMSGLGNLLFLLSILAIPIAIAIAILRYNLYDINVIVRKTLVYAALTALLGLVYFGSVVLLQRLFGAVTGFGQSPLAIVVSTLVIAALFTPLRRRIQDWIDRRFYRKKYDAQQVLARFALTARDETDLDALTVELARVVEETLRPERVGVWLKGRPS
jgi:hypothetical protein